MWSLRRAFPAVRRHLQAHTAGHASSFQVPRAFASDAEEFIPLPIQVHGVAGKYASALFRVASRQKKLDTVEKELKTVVEAAKGSPTFQEFIKDPSIRAEIRVKIIQECFSEFKLSDITRNFLVVLAEYGRLREFFKTVESYSDLLSAQRGEVKIKVTAALPLTDAELQEMSKILQARYLQPGKTLILDQKVDRSIIGGFVVDTQDTRFDLSVKKRINDLVAELSKPVG